MSLRAVGVAALFTVALVTGPAKAQDAETGEQVFRQCRACHQIGDNAKNLVGPQLNGIVGRKAGTVDGFKYSPVNIDAGGKGLVWTEEVLMQYLEAPLKFMPGNRMAFNGLKDEQQRKDLIAYLKKFTK